MRHRTRDRLFLLLKCLIAALFIFAGVGKILNPAVFAQDIDNYRLLPYFLVTLVAVILPWLEVLTGILLIIGRWKKSAAFMLLVLCFTFLIAIGSAMARGLDITCGCFSMTNEGTRVGYMRLIEDIVLFGLIVMITVKEFKEKVVMV